MSNDGSDDSPFTLRRATPQDAPGAAEVYLASYRAAEPDIPALTHTSDEVRQWVSDVVRAHEVWLAEQEGELSAMMVLDGDVLDQLYVDPRWQSHGVGGALVRLAQSRRPGGLSLWTFQTNLGAQRFYERHGFVAVERTDGSGNNEQAPDVRYVWPSPPNA